MCRIAGMIHSGIPIPEIERIVLGMCNLLKHGGPDDEGLYTSPDEHLVLGNRRLAILDLSVSGHQPMVYNERYFITYNGELYNFLSLKEELKNLGHIFNTETDTEVILAAYAQWNTQAFAKFKGMFAFGLWDNHLKELLLVRDAAGIKPLYYSTATGGVTFASELRAFTQVPYLHHANPDWPVFLMAYGHIPEPVTTLQDVKPLHKGFFLKYESLSGKQSIQSFAHYSYIKKDFLHNNNESSTLVHTFKKAVERHLISDAPIGVFLSGGLDSSIITSVAAQFKLTSLNSLSIYFEEDEYSEKKYQDILLEQVKCTPHQYLLEEKEFHDKLPHIIRAMDMPGCDGINTWFISKYAAAEGLKAVLSGIGADELFGGYPSFKRIKYSGALRQLPATVTRRGSGSSIKRFNRLSYLQLKGIKGIYLFLRGHYSPNDIARQLGCSEKEVWTILDDMPVINELNDLHLKDQASWMEFNMYMQNQLLRDADVMGMAHGVEIRVPFLDDDFLRQVLSIDPGVKYGGQLPKQWLIDQYKASLPQAIWDRPKMGFSFPFRKWLASSSFVKDLMHRSGEATLWNYNKFLEGNLHWSQLMSLILLKSKNEV